MLYSFFFNSQFRFYMYLVVVKRLHSFYQHHYKVFRYFLTFIPVVLHNYQFQLIFFYLHLFYQSNCLLFLLNLLLFDYILIFRQLIVFSTFPQPISRILVLLNLIKIFSYFINISYIVQMPHLFFISIIVITF